MKPSDLGYVLNSLEHVFPFPLKDVIYRIALAIWRVDRFYSSYCWFCRRHGKRMLDFDGEGKL